ncbi:sulfatase-like hydrolase/transferase [Lentibacter algarum]|uniref:sulfatase-like hydrolase/transferase n=1 Tax=Lentibacter algarum TaxID=576131 RepID=UPI001C0745B4|nr:sulfatase-like hydrolase/transferase [Lentibacter algarum]MBU2981373.1 sulfatase-like hydrolase/transferase [Lentibacter algarum]
MTAPTDRPNIVLISFDDAIAFWKYRDVFGIELQTPNLDRICAQSTAFHSAYCQSPICGPSRTSFMSGKTPHQTLNFENATRFYDSVEPREMWPAKLKKAGYFCSAGGKVHHGRGLPKGVAEVLYTDRPKLFGGIGKLPPKFKHIRTGGWRKGYALTDEKDFDQLYDRQSASSAVAFLDGYDEPEPFYREVGFHGPHGPFITPLSFKKAYDFRKFTKPESWADDSEGCLFDPDKKKEIFDDSAESLDFWRKTVRSYFAALSHADQQLGRVWDALKASKHADNTVVMIVSDHGFHLGDKKRLGKTTLFEQIANVPLIVHVPQGVGGQVVKDPVAMLDVGQTALDYAGLPPLDGCVGQSLRPYVEGERVPERAIPTFHHGHVSIRKGAYRLIRYDDGRTQFFDLENDPWQTRNLGEAHSDFAMVMQALRSVSAQYGLTVEDAA